MIQKETSTESQSGLEIISQPQPESTFDREAAMRAVAHQLVHYSLEVNGEDTVWIQFETLTGDMAQMVVEEIKKIPGAKYLISFATDHLEKAMLEAVSHDNFKHPTQLIKDIMVGNTVLKPIATETEEDEAREDFMFSGPIADKAHFLSRATKVLRMLTRNNLEDYVVDEQVEKNYGATLKPVTTLQGKKRWCLYRPPTEAEAEALGMDFNEYQKKYYETCSRDWEAVEKAQEVLIEILEQGKRIIMDVPAPEGLDPQKWHTHVEMGINGNKSPNGEYHTFVNSVAKRNMPGSEVYTGPDAGTLEGTFSLPYPVMLKDMVVPNLILRFKDGKVIKKEDGTFDFDTDGTEAHRQHIQKILSTDEGASGVGELGIGTNPVVDFPTRNTMLLEKIGGFHLAIGSAYEYKNYLGTAVDIDNGNRSANHIDISRIMSPRWGGGTMTIIKDVPSENGMREQAEIIFENGRFLDPRLAILNKPE